MFGLRERAAEFVPVVGEIAADLARTGSAAHPIDPSRLAAAPA
ncbi:hypothetical protein ACIHCV_12780 [Streptomyces sp. NPDC051956]